MSFRALGAVLVVTTFLVAPAMAGQVDWQGPAGSLKFGAQVAVLPNGNIVVTDPADPAGGAAYLYRPDHTLISKVTGVNPGATPTADYETIKIVVLKNGNYVLVNTGWSSASTPGVGMVAWGSATTGISGVISASNALVGSVQGDYVGSDGVMPLSNGNYIVRSRNWDNGSLDEAGAVTWGNGDGGTVGPVSSSNSLVGTKAREHVGWYAWTLSNGNYVALTHVWNNGTANVGAATWGNGASGTTGIISSANSLVGSTFNDFIGATVTPLTNGNYVVAVPYWDKNGIVDAGAVVWANGATGRKGVIAANIALTGDKTGNFVGYPQIVALTNGNYVVGSSDWEDASHDDQGAVTWGNGTTGRTGIVSSANSLVGDQSFQYIGDDWEHVTEGIVALSNGHYVVPSPRWGTSGKPDLGAVTWGNGNTGTTGVVSAANSLVGASSGDMVGLYSVHGVRPLSNGNYVVSSRNWKNSEGIEVGALTWRNGSASSPGVVSATNSVIGAVDVVTLKDGNYILASSNGMSWTDGATPRTAPLTAENGLMRLGNVITVMDDGSYIVCQAKGIDGPDASGAVAWVPKGENLLGELSAKNALVGTTADDKVCTDYIDAESRALEDGRYMMFNYYWDNGAIVNARALTLMTRGMAGPVGASNSVVGTVGFGGESVTGRSGFSYDYDPVRKHAVVGRYASNVVSLLTAPNDSGPNLSVSDVSISEGNSGTKVATFTVQLSAASASPVTYDISTANGTSTAGSDYVGSYLVGQTIPAGSTSKTFSVTINGDGASEADELFTVNVNNVVGAKLTDGQAVGKIVNDDGTSLSIDDVTLSEGAGGTKQMTFTVKLQAAIATPVTYNIATSNGTATAGSDYVAASLTGQTIPAGSTSNTFTVLINGDTAEELDETFNVTLSNVSGASIGDGVAVGTIVNDDLPVVMIDDVSIVEGNSGTKQMTFTVSLSIPSLTPITYSIGTNGNTALPGSDFVSKLLEGETIPAGQTSRTFTVTINGDVLFEPNESFWVEVFNVTGRPGFRLEGIGTIVNDDAAAVNPVLSVADVSVTEGNGVKQAVLTVSLDKPATTAVTYSIATAAFSATPGQDFTSTSLTGQVIPAGSTSGTVSVPIIGDTVPEFEEFFLFSVSSVVGADVGLATAKCFIVDDDQPGLSIADVAIEEGSSGTREMTFTIQLSAMPTSPVSFNIATSNGTATAGSDYVATSQSGLTIPTSVHSTTFVVPINGDTTVESHETFNVTVSNVVGATVVDGQAIGTIGNDDGPGIPTISIGDVSISEGNSGTKQAVFTISLSAAASGAVTYDVATSNSTATAGSDYVATSLIGQTIAAGATSKTFSVPINGDTVGEADEVFQAALSNVVGAFVGDAVGSATITNDDAGSGPGMSIADISVVEGNDGGKFAFFNVTLAEPSTDDVWFSLASSDGTATAGSDYNAVNVSSQMISRGNTSASVLVIINGDTVAEANETFNVTLSQVVNATVVDGQAVATILNDDGGGPASTLSIGDVSIAEGDGGSKTATFTVSLSAAAATAVTYDIATSNGTATAGSDYVASSLTGQSIPAGQTSKTFTVTINGDTAVEPDETFNITLTNPTGATIADGSAVGTITNDDGGGAPVLSITDVSIAEGNSGSKLATFTLNLSGPAATAVTYDIATAAGTATAPADFINKSQTAQTIAAGQTSKTFTVSIKGDTVTEPDETFQVDVTNVVGATLGDGQAVGTITNDDGAVAPAMSIADVSISEGNSGTKIATFTVTLSAAASTAVTYDIATSNGTATAGSDYVASSLTGQSITAGQTSKTFSVTINGDTTVESDESFTVTLSNAAGATIGDGSAVGTITNDDTAGAPTLSIGDMSISEGNSGTKTATFTVTLSAAAANAVSYDIATSNGTATAGSDYVASSLVGQSIGAGQTSQTFSVTINGDTTVESDETFTVTLSNPSGATISDGSAVGTITNDDTASGSTLTIGDVSIAEGNSGSKLATFTLTLSAPAATAVTYNIATAADTATAPADFVNKSQTAQSIAAGQTSKAFTVSIKGDTITEPDETFFVNVTNVTGATLGDGQAVGTITNDDGVTTPTLSIADVSISEGNSGTKSATFTVTLSAAASAAVTYDIATSNGTATAGSDYVASSLAAQSIAAGQTSKTFSVTINGDTTAESDETFTVTLANPSGATVADGSAVGTITNDDSSGSPTLSMGDVSIVEGNAGTATATFTVSLSAAAANAVTYDIATSNGTATAGSDYVASSLTGQSIAAGQTSQTFSVTINGDTTVESDETFTVALSNPSGATISDGSAIGTITNDDTSGGGQTLSIGDVTLAEGNALNTQFTFTVSLSAAAAGTVSFNIATADGTALAGTDYTAKSAAGQTIAAGTTSKTFTVLVKGDRTLESNETFQVNVTGVTGATLGDGQAIGTITNDDAGLMTVARVVTGGLVDDIDDGNGQPVVGKDEYALLLLDTAQAVCERAQAPTIAGIDGVENRWVLEDLAETVNLLCRRERHYAAVFDNAQGGEGLGFLVEVADTARSEGARVLDARTLGQDAALATLTVLANGHDKAVTVLLARDAASTKPGKAGDLDRYLAARRKLDPEARLIVLGANERPDLVDASVLAAQMLELDDMPILLPNERIFVSESLLDAFGNAEVILPYLDIDPQVLKLQP
ncbi:Calx-beta domain-containing protein [Arenimonas sp.]|uniref:Calx-beta domain-containing protein n=1 Tax=Arenimonas sp. TaxID=1872635 RepID=UPI0039E33EDA